MLQFGGVTSCALALSGSILIKAYTCWRKSILNHIFGCHSRIRRALILVGLTELQFIVSYSRNKAIIHCPSFWEGREHRGTRHDGTCDSIFPVSNKHQHFSDCRSILDQLEASQRIPVILITANYSSAASEQQICGLNMGPPICELKDKGCCSENSKSPCTPTRGQKTAI